MITVFCLKHPTYTAIRPPTNPCEQCRIIWNALAKPEGLCIARHDTGRTHDTGQPTEKQLTAGKKTRKLGYQ